MFVYSPAEYSSRIMDIYDKSFFTIVDFSAMIILFHSL